MALDVGAKIRQWREDPVSFVRELFGAEPDPWQHKVLTAFPSRQRIALPSAKGPGKSCVEAWLSWNFLLTRPNPKIAATSISGDNLRDGLWTEMAKWQQKSPLLLQLFEWTTTRIFAKENPQQWWMSARTWPQNGDATQQANTLAGLHADYIMFVIDESGGMTDAVMVSAEAALSSCKEGHIIQAGNPTQLSGPLYRAYINENNLWFVVCITGDPDDPERSPRISADWARQQIAEYGRENQWVLTNVFGKFPAAAFNSLISSEEVYAAQKRYYRDFEIGRAPKIIGVDVAKYGDDSSVLMRRHGIQALKPMAFRQISGTQGAGIVSREWGSWEADAVFIDDTGGYGGSWIEQLRVLGRTPFGVHFAASAHNKSHFENKRAEMYFDMVQWIRDGGALPDDKNLADALIKTTYTIKKDLLMLEPKAMIKAKMNGRSPDEADALALTFAEPVTPVASTRRGKHVFEYDPFALVDRRQDAEYGW